MKKKNNKNKVKYGIYMNVRLSDVENNILNQLMKVFKTYNKSKIVRYLINNNKILKEEKI